jgi:hypothetical protein
MQTKAKTQASKKATPQSFLNRPMTYKSAQDILGWRMSKANTTMLVEMKEKDFIQVPNRRKCEILWSYL